MKIRPSVEENRSSVGTLDGGDGVLFVQKASVTLGVGESYNDIRLPKGELGSIWRYGKFERHGVPWSPAVKNERAKRTFTFRRAVIVITKTVPIKRRVVVVDRNRHPMLDANGERQYRMITMQKRELVKVQHAVWDYDLNRWVPVS
jgi:hypothetical protein